MTEEKIHFVTGRLAESALRETVQRTAQQRGFEFSIQVLPITVAALLTTQWIAPRLEIPPKTTRIILPGYVSGDIDHLQQVVERSARRLIPVELGPKDLRRLPEFLGGKSARAPLEHHHIEIIAEINHAPRLEIEETLRLALAMQADGADVIDVGCDPGRTWLDVPIVVKELVDRGIRVSIDSFNPREVELAVGAGASLVLSVNGTNIRHAPDWGCEVVAVPDQIHDIETLVPSIEFLQQKRVPFRIDPILEPIGFGFAASLRRYMDARERWPDLEIMMGIGNLTELSDVDSAGVNLILLAICEELKIRSVLTTQVVNWARSAVRECDIARRMVCHAIDNRVPPKHLSEQLVMLRDPKVFQFRTEQIQQIADQIRDNNYRILAEDEQIHLLGSGLHLHGSDPFQIFDQLFATLPSNLDASHAFYLGYEMCKALTAITLGKEYTQDEALRWGHLTREEKNRHRLTKRFRKGERG